jgi:hypothetical protein
MVGKPKPLDGKPVIAAPRQLKASKKMGEMLNRLPVVEGKKPVKR